MTSNTPYHVGGDRDLPADVEPGSDADIDRGQKSEPGADADEPSPEDEEDGEQMDDNIDDLGRRPDVSVQEQPGIPK